MAISFFGLAIFLFLTLDSDFTSSPISTASEGVQITYGSVIKLMHERTKFRLHSHDVPYGSGSGQQSVTGFLNVDDSNSYWIVRPVPDTNAQQGDTIKGGTIIRLQHMRTRKWLHCHLLNCFFIPKRYPADLFERAEINSVLDWHHANLRHSSDHTFGLHQEKQCMN
ncbi:stromal cell-derived factor 2-like protein isoform X1 [Coffea arabica]|uniref:Stromal cell-derived factor 2-like protein isoform X1 n=1 Tax=Coffea arabica TaxID=13443 RepID=A0A6P6SCH4_COFAR|nr:stromal cell-derived factor 2-like protein isoform X2 [Coffea arabica]